MSDLRQYFEGLLYRGRRRYTQHSPVMPDVWVEYGLAPSKPQDLLLVANWKSTPGTLAKQLKERLLRDRGKYEDILRRDPAANDSPRIAYNQSSVAASLWFSEVIRVALPLSSWWRKYLAKGKDDDPVARFVDPEGRGQLLEELIRAFSDPGYDTRTGQFTADMVWLAQVVGTIALVGERSEEDPAETYKRPQVRRELLERLEGWSRDYPAVVHALFALLDGMEGADVDEPPSLYSVNLNRETLPSIVESTAAIKADASRNLFGVTGRNICWAVIDSGIDAEHLAFRQRMASGEPIHPAFKTKEAPKRQRPGGEGAAPTAVNNTRIKGTYDFTWIRDLLSAEPDKLNKLPKELHDRLEELGKLGDLKRALESQQDGRMTNWELFESVLEVPHEQGKYRAPTHPHGTHVAGIIAADWREGDVDDKQEDAGPETEGVTRVTGVCPDIELYDLRALDDKGVGREFSIMAALQFVRYLNARHDFVEVHGVNLSFSIEHQVSNYACGRTPVCVECERLVGSGIVVVAAAGNSGRARYLTPDGLADEGFRTVSITDPGNAQEVITVGSTHRIEPHTYGVSYFSSRGPTGDGRQKPDLVAPGEKIRSTIPGNRDEYLDGTSMAAPHVSGAAALIMARNYEFIGQPTKIKEVLCGTATDLGRERYFQGAGLLDILRALQSI